MLSGDPLGGPVDEGERPLTSLPPTLLWRELGSAGHHPRRGKRGEVHGATLLSIEFGAVLEEEVLSRSLG